MVRSFSNRILGGVCGGFGRITPLNGWFWRLLFIVLALSTSGVGALVYVLFWWLLPLDSPVTRVRGGGLSALIALLLSIALIGAWFGRDALGLADLYWPLALLLLALVFLITQITSGQWHNLALALVTALIPAVFLLRELEILTGGAADLTLRAWPALLIFFGLALALRYRLRFGSWLALIFSVALVAGVAAFAYNSRIDAPRDDNRIEIAAPNTADHELAAISPNVTTLLIDIATLDTDVEIAVRDDDDRQIGGLFTGSDNSLVAIDYGEEGDVASLRLTESAREEFPPLEALGRGRLDLRLPRNLAVGITFRGERADVLRFDMGGINLEQLIFELREGDALVRLPVYQPLSPSVRESNGRWQVFDGSLQIFVPEDVGVRFLLDRALNNEPQPGDNGTYDARFYRLELEPGDFVLTRAGFDDFDVQVRYRLDVLSGNLRIITGENTEE